VDWLSSFCRFDWKLYLISSEKAMFPTFSAAVQDPVAADWHRDRGTIILNNKSDSVKRVLSTPAITCVQADAAVNRRHDSASLRSRWIH